LNYWNSTLSIIDYFDAAIEPGFFSVLPFIYNFGNISSFIIMPRFQNKYSLHRILKFCSLGTLLSFLVLVYSTEIFDIILVRKILSGVFVFLLGIIMCSFQSKAFEFSASISPHEIMLCNFGTGVNGILINIIVYILDVIFVSPNSKVSELRIRTYIFTLVIVGVFFFFHYLNRKFENRYIREDYQPLDLQEPVMNDTEQAEDAHGDLYILKNAWFQYLNMVFLYFTTISFFTFLIYKSCDLYDKGTYWKYTIYMFAYNIFDTLGKFIPPHWFMTSPLKTSIFNLARFVPWLLVAYIVYFNNVPVILTSPFIRIVLMIGAGLTNGFINNSIYGQAAAIFSSVHDKGKSGYFCVLFLILGILAGCTGGLVMEQIYKAVKN